MNKQDVSKIQSIRDKLTDLLAILDLEPDEYCCRMGLDEKVLAYPHMVGRTQSVVSDIVRELDNYIEDLM